MASIFGSLTEAQKIAVRVPHRELRQPIRHLFWPPLGRALLAYAVPQLIYIVDVDVLRRCCVRATEMGVPHEQYCDLIPLKPTPSIILGGDAAESENLFVPFPCLHHVIVWSIGTRAVIRIPLSVSALTESASAATSSDQERTSTLSDRHVQSDDVMQLV